MAEKTHNAGNAVHYKFDAPAGVASAVATNAQGAVGSAATFGPWLAQQLAESSVPVEQVALLSGFTVADLKSLMKGQPVLPLDADHVQRLATALSELHAVHDQTPVWEAAGFGESEYLIPPEQVVRTMSGPT